MSFTESITATESGTIVAWHGMLSEIPDGWVLCDGNNGTEDLRQRFVKAPSDYSLGSGGSGGNGTVTISQSQTPSHSHDPVSVQSAGDHSHTMDGSDAIDGADNQSPVNTNGPGGVKPNDGDKGSNSHATGSLDSIGSGQAIDMDPKHYEVAFIEKL